MHADGNGFSQLRSSAFRARKKITCSISKAPRGYPVPTCFPASARHFTFHFPSSPRTKWTL